MGVYREGKSRHLSPLADQNSMVFDFFFKEKILRTPMSLPMSMLKTGLSLKVTPQLDQDT